MAKVSKEIKKERERIKKIIKDKLEGERHMKRIRTGEARMNHILDHINFNIDNPNNVRKDERE